MIVSIDGADYVVDRVGETVAEQLRTSRRPGQARRVIPVVYFK